MKSLFFVSALIVSTLIVLPLFGQAQADNTIQKHTIFSTKATIKSVENDISVETDDIYITKNNYHYNAYCSENIICGDIPRGTKCETSKTQTKARAINAFDPEQKASVEDMRGELNFRIVCMGTK